MGLEARDRKFLLDGKELRLVSGAMHYFRIVPEYWEDRILRMKAGGLNCLETYVPWNLHEEVRGEFNFSGILDIRRYIELAHKHGLYVLFRPGPYICSEWEFGGLPSWLLSDSKMKVRSSYQPYLDACDAYLAKLLPLVADLQYSRGGPIIAIQIENEYGSYGNDLKYKTFLKETFTKYGMTELYFTSDNGTGIQKGEVPGVLQTSNFQEQEHGHLMFEYLRHVKQPDAPHMVMEFWAGWFDHWSEKHHVWPIEQYEKVLRWILAADSSVNFYMYHGGTNFAFMNGANEGLGATNEGGKEPYQADVTSYDYDCPVAENGDLTPKWHATRKILQEMLPQVPSSLPDPPPNVPTTAYGDVEVTDMITLQDLLTLVEGLPSDKPLPMESLPINNNGGQSFGFTLYRASVGAVKDLTFTGRVRDRASIIVDGKQVDVVEWTKPKSTYNLNLTGGSHELDILVENLGRVNYADFNSPVLNDQRKGLQDPVLADKAPIKGWTIFPLEFKQSFVEKASSSDKWRPVSGDGSGAALYRATLNIEGEPKDTFINMQGWSKGVVFVNGFNLGRYWEIGPQETLYLPAPLLNTGQNTILVFELHHARPTVTFSSTALLGATMVHSTHVPAYEKALLGLLKQITRLGPWTWKFLKVFVR